MKTTPLTLRELVQVVDQVADTSGAYLDSPVASMLNLDPAHPSGTGLFLVFRLDGEPDLLIRIAKVEDDES